MPPQHAPARLSTYLRVHENRLEGLRRQGVVLDDTLVWGSGGENEVTLSGEIACRGGIVVKVWKVLRVIDGGPVEPSSMVQTEDYSYNAFVRGHRSFLRHDNSHPHAGHPDEHPRHEMDWRTETDLPGSPFHCGAVGWPHLDEFILEVDRWYEAHSGELPDQVATLGVRD